jgi:DNA replication and repair protein RecF
MPCRYGDALSRYNRDGAFLHVHHLQLRNFRNYRELDIDLPTGNLLFLGDNAQGKSNLLEAVYLLATAKSARASADAEVIGWQAEAAPQPVARVAATVERRQGDVGLEVAIVGAAPSAVAAMQARRAGKRLRVNAIPRRAIDLVGQLRAVLFTADDLDIVNGSPAERRRYLDVTLSQIDRRYYASLQRYTRIVQQRNAALRRVKEGKASPDELPFWDESLAREGSVIVAGRLAACARLAPLAASAHRDLSGAAAEALELDYQPRLGEDWLRLLPERAEPAAAERIIAAALVAQRRREVAAGVSLVGPHRDDIVFSINGAPAAAYASRAQIRTATLALRLAEARLLEEDAGDPPVLLLDDILSELDERRRASVLESIAGADQAWFTATDAGALPDSFLSRTTVYRVQAGAITAA